MIAMTEIQHEWTPAPADSPLALAVLAELANDPSLTRRVLSGLLANHVKVTITVLHGKRIKCDRPPAWPVWGKATQTVITVDGVVKSETKWDQTEPAFGGYNEQDGVRIYLETARGHQARYV